jgi:pentatricopeptide repeat protein
MSSIIDTAHVEAFRANGPTVYRSPFIIAPLHSTLRNCTTIRKPQPTENIDDLLYWDEYLSMVHAGKEKVRLVKKQERDTDYTPVIQFLTSKERVLNRPRLQGDFENIINKQRELFLAKTNFTLIQYNYGVKLLSYLGDLSAKQQQPMALSIAWGKLLESGMIPRQASICTYMYALSLDERTAPLSGEAATFHDLLFEPNESTAYLRIKSLIAEKDAKGAEMVLQTLPSVDSARLRTFQPILQYYCKIGDLDSALRVYGQMRDAPGVHLDPETYAILLGSIAQNGGFFLNAQPIESAAYVGFSSSSGPKLLDELLQEMADDILEIDSSAARTLYNSFLSAFGERKPSTMCLLGTDHDIPTCEDDNTGDVIISRVAVDVATGVCPLSGVKLSLFRLDPNQQQHVHRTLIAMAKDQYIEFYQNGRGRKPKSGGSLDEDYPVRELERFSSWLADHKENPFTAILDGANIAYYGHGSVRYSQIHHVVKRLEEMHERPLVIMPHKYLQTRFYAASIGSIQELDERSVKFIDDLREQGKLYEVPPLCLDDYYWMIASVSDDEEMIIDAENSNGQFPGVRPMLITNDQMRDHKLELLEPRLFRRWSSSHVVNYIFPNSYEEEWEERPIEFCAADFFSREIQGNVKNNTDGSGGSLVWHIPVLEWGEHERLCLKIY